MKSLKALVLLSLCAVGFNSFAFESDKTNTLVTAGIFTAPTSAVVDLYECVRDSNYIYDDGRACDAAYVHLLSVSLTTTLAFAKEELKQVETDALDFLAGEGMTLALEEVIKELRQTAPELEAKTDKEIATYLLMI